MGVFDSFRGRDDEGRLARSVVDTNNFEASQTLNSSENDPEHGNPQGFEGKHAHAATTSATDSTQPASPAIPPHSSSTPSFGANGASDDEKEAERNPDRVTDQAGLGQQKAEAAALVWSRSAVFGIYAWCVNKSLAGNEMHC